MPIYNVEKYLEEAINSVIAQDIGFKENVQLILINDGSPDNSGEICEKYAQKFPENVIYLKKKNGGLSDARNFGIKYTKGELVTFTDPDDTLSENVFSEVWKFWEENKHEKNFAIINLPLVYFESKNGIHPKYKNFPKENILVDLNENPNYYILSSASSFYRRDIFKNFTFNEKNFGSEDLELNIKVQIANPKIGYVAGRGVQYNYRIRKSNNSIMDGWISNPGSYLSDLAAWKGIIKFIKKNRPIPDFVKDAIIYDLRGRILHFGEVEGFSKEQKSEIKNQYNKLLDLVGDYRISQSNILSKQQKILYFSRILTRKPKIADKKKMVFSGGGEFFLHYPIVKNIEQKNKKVLIEALFFDYGFPIQLVLKKSDSKKIIQPTTKRSFNSSYDMRYGKIILSCTSLVRFYVNKEDIGKYSFLYNYNNKYFSTKVWLFRYLPFIHNSQKIRKNYGEIDLKIYDGTVEILPKGNRFDDFRSKILTTFSLLQRYKNIAKTRFLGFFANKWILISDRPFKAGDNGEAIFRYISENEPKLKKRAIFVLQKDSPDFRRLKKIGKVVPHGSLRHKFYFLNSKLILSSHNHPKFVSPDGYKNFQMYADLMDRKFIWLQHGVTQNNIFGAANKFNQGISAVVLATNFEKKIFSQDNFFYDENDLILSGFPRWDYNENRAEKLITIAPTWRGYLSGPILPDGTHEVKSGFENSEYFKAWSAVLSDKKLIKKLRTNNIKLDFAMHPGFLRKIDLFKKLENDVVNIVEFVNYQEIFEKSALMITDFSSAVFDFAYMRKPVLYYQFDKERFFAEHYKPSKYFNYEENAPGKVLQNHADLITEILNLIDENFALPKIYRQRIDQMFLYDDHNNSRRVVDWLKKNHYLEFLR